MSYTSGRNRMAKIPTTAPLPVTFEAGPGFVTAVIHAGPSTLGLKFESPEQLLYFLTDLMEHAVFAWPDNPFVQMYVEEEGARSAVAISASEVAKNGASSLTNKS
ncbi:MAG: hypothetical protein BroJett011_33810 [Chloroflexota bacterium]|nr:MAG: hypothetical protein BroJett011_33810 [Chloroflexota bacterium]